MALSIKEVLRLGDFPVEIILEIFHQLDLNSICSLSMVNKQFRALFERGKAMILTPVLMRDFGPFDELLQVHTASAADLDLVTEQYRPRTVVLKRFPGDRGITLRPHSRASASVPRHANDNGFAPVTGGRAQHPSSDGREPVVLTDQDLRAILRRCKTVQWWEEIFPQMRWNFKPEDCRSLRPHERYRARRALYRFWLYGIYFHGEPPRPHLGLPEPMVRDIRTSFLRYFSSSELFELMDFVEVVKDLISYYICPRLDPGIFKVDADMPWMRGPSRESSMNGGFVDRTCWGRIIKTYAKLGPEEMMHYVKNICSFPRTRLIRDIEDRHPNFTVDQESIQVSIRCVLEERLWLDSPPSFPDDSVGGIIDFDDERDDERVARGDDASADGWPPGWLGSKLSASRSLYSPRGDDGHDAEGNPLYQAEMLRRMQRVLLETRARKADVSIDS